MEMRGLPFGLGVDVGDLFGLGELGFEGKKAADELVLLNMPRGVLEGKSAASLDRLPRAGL